MFSLKKISCLIHHNPKHKDINTLPFPFDDDILSHVSDSDDEEQDQHDLDIEVVARESLDPNQWPKSKWAQTVIEATGNGSGNPDDRRRTRSQYQNEHVALSHTASLSTEWCNKLPGKCYLMIANDQQFGPLKNKIDHSIPPPERRNKYKFHQIRITLIGSHAQLQDVTAQKNHAAG